MDLDPVSCHRAMLARDARFDGRFFTCVSSTGIYCRPICPARPPRIENCLFVASAAEAQEAGYRACLRCRPDTAPDSPAWQGTATTVARALRLIAEGALDDGPVAGLAARLGVGERHLRRLFALHVGASPATVALTRRILTAKQLLHDSDLGMLEIALASGFGSLRRFNEVFRDQFGRPPHQLRRHRPARAETAARVCIDLPYRAPYDWGAMLDFLGSRAIPGVEQVSGGTYRRTIRAGGVQGSVRVANAPDRRALAAEIRIDSLAAIPGIIERLKRVFDTRCDPSAIHAVFARDRLLAPLIARRPGLRVPGAWDGFELGVRAILGQQVSVSAASSLAGQLAARYGDPVHPGEAGLTHIFPAPEALSRFEETGETGMPVKRAAAIGAFARAAARDPRLVTGELDLAETTERLQALPGIGAWTTSYFAMRALQDSDAFPAGDVALQRILRAAGIAPGAETTRQRIEGWRPWRSYAVLHLWTAEREGDPGALAA